MMPATGITIATPNVSGVVTVTIEDGSDNGGLILNQTIRVSGKPGLWVVIGIRPSDGDKRMYDIRKVPGNRKQQRSQARVARIKNRKG